MATKYRKKCVLWVDDNRFDIDSLVGEFFLSGDYNLLIAHTADEAIAVLEGHNGAIDLAILDVRLPTGSLFSPERAHGGFRGGIVLGEAILAKYPDIPLLGFSVCAEAEIDDWFTSHGQYYLQKHSGMNSDYLFKLAEAIIDRAERPNQNPRIFIVHGHDHEAKLELKNYLQNILKLGEPIILHEQPNQGRTIIEKLETEASSADIVFVLITPDDVLVSQPSTNAQKRQARQNVIFEMGYFYGRLNRRMGRVILCYKGELELPSDISGIVYIDISNGIEAAGEEIRRELKDWLTH